eukprot:scaffold7820_cov99-Skeletonema_marinoi.AAC.3
MQTKNCSAPAVVIPLSTGVANTADRSQGRRHQKQPQGQAHHLLSTQSSMPSTSSNPSASISLQPSSSIEPSGGPTLFPTISASPSHEHSLKPSVSFEPSSSQQPSGGPTLLPTISARPSRQPSVKPSISASKAPSHEPSSNPSSSSSPSGLPSFAPSMSKLPSGSPSSSGGDSGSDCDDPSDPLSCYEFVGIGVCADSQVPQLSDALPFIVYARSADLSRPSDCASKCTECVNGAVSNGSFRGFTLDSGACVCAIWMMKQRPTQTQV